MDFVRFSVVAATSVPAAEAFARVVPRDDSTLFHRFLVLPGVTGISDATGPWTHAGETRLVHLSDGSRFREELVVHEPPASGGADGSGDVGRFDYRVSEYTGVLAKLVSDAVAEWRYEPAGHGSLIRWSYGFRPLPGRRFVVKSLIGPIWSAYMRRSIRECVRVADGA